MAKKIDVEKLRARLKLTQRDLADRLGIDQGTLSRIETGAREPSKPVQKLLEQIATLP